MKLALILFTSFFMLNANAGADLDWGTILSKTQKYDVDAPQVYFNGTFTSVFNTCTVDDMIRTKNQVEICVESNQYDCTKTDSVYKFKKLVDTKTVCVDFNQHDCIEYGEVEEVTATDYVIPVYKAEVIIEMEHTSLLFKKDFSVPSCDTTN